MREMQGNAKDLALKAMDSVPNRREKQPIVERDDVQRWRSDQFDDNLHERLVKEKLVEKKQRLKITEKLQTVKADKTAAARRGSE